MSLVDERLNKSKCAVLFIDQQSGLNSLVRDIPAEDYKNQLSGLVDICNFFKLPYVLTSSNESGPNGPVLSYVQNNLSPDNNAGYIQRNGEINAWDNSDFRNAVISLIKNRGVTQFIISGIVTEVCVAFVVKSISNVIKTDPDFKDVQLFVAVDSSGTSSEFIRQASWTRMLSTGAEFVTWFAIACELRGNWNPQEEGDPSLNEFSDMLLSHYPEYFNVNESYVSASSNN